MKYLFLVAAVLSETIGTSALQASNQFTKFWPSVTVVISYALAFYFLSITLK
jgi:small multidrug resistance pump